MTFVIFSYLLCEMIDLTNVSFLCLLVLRMQFKSEEITGILTDFAEPGHLAPTGLHLGGAKYMVIQGEPGAVIRGKKVTYMHINLLLH